MANTTRTCREDRINMAFGQGSVLRTARVGIIKNAAMEETIKNKVGIRDGFRDGKIGLGGRIRPGLEIKVAGMAVGDGVIRTGEDDGYQLPCKFVNKFNWTFFCL